MASITNGRRKTLELSPDEGVRLASIVAEALDRLGYNLPAAARATTLTTSAIRRIRSDKGEGPTRIFLYTFVYLCDGLGLDPVEIAESMGVTLEPADLATSMHGLAARRRQRGLEAPARQRAYAPTAPPVSDGDNSLTRFIDQEADRRVAEEIERRVEIAVRRRLEGLG